MSTPAQERFLDICRFKRTGDLYLSSGFNWFYQQTLMEWVNQGAPGGFEKESFFLNFKSRVNDYFKLEPMRWLYEINSGVIYVSEAFAAIGGSRLAVPHYEPKVLSEDERAMIKLNPAGQTIKVLKEAVGYGMPLFLSWPVKDRASWEEHKKRLDPNSAVRYPSDWNAYVAEINGLSCPVSLQVGGFFSFLREWVGQETLLYLFYDDPGLVEDMMDVLLYIETEIIKRVSKDIHFQMVTYHEDMAYRAGPMISPDMFRRFMMPRYRKLNELIHSLGVDIIYVDCDGNIDLLIPLWLECGVNFVWPLEVAAGNDAVVLRKKYGRDLIMGGNIDKRVLAKGKEAIKQEVMSKVPFLLEKGAYFPSTDHLVSPDIPFENFCYFINLLREIGGLEKLEF
jgi:uroporphyrinogen-III decarboxylase